jgi:hypothetical protein
MNVAEDCQNSQLDGQGERLELYRLNSFLAEKPGVSRLLLIPLLLLSVLLTSCGQVFVGFVSNPGNPGRISGTITAVQVGFLNNGAGTWVTVTFVTFLNGSRLTSVNFCGDQRSQFPINTFAQVEFNMGISCSTLITVSIE